ncbi:g6385 [Coccomyxa viridis]|uniref:G6385 protein n=1 Tax=Coccomyxa viridis TaxID=1274662 RepID=A0ABP1FXK5_9CHLO
MARMHSHLGSSTSEATTFPTSAQDYTLHEKIGKGSSSTVYRATVNATGQEIAVKKVDLEALGANLDTVIREAVIMKRQRHPHILELLAAFVDGSDLWMVIPLVPGGSLESLIKKGYQKGLREVDIATIMKQVLEGLAYLHSRGIIHRDIKASNILVGRDGTVRLSDLGVAAKLERHFSCTLPEGYAKLERRNTFVGSPAYIAPELLTGLEQGYGLSADIYSFGITIIEVALGHTPYVDMSFRQIVTKKAANAGQPMLSVNTHGKHFSQEFGDAVAQCVQYCADERPSAEHFLKHRFFKLAARHPQHLVRHLWRQVPEDSDRSGSSSHLASDSDAEGPLGGDGMHHGHGSGWLSPDSAKQLQVNELPEVLDASHASMQLKRLLLHSTGQDSLSEAGEAPMCEILQSCCACSMLPWLVAAAISSCTGIFFGLGQMQGLGLQHLHGMGFIMAKLEAPDGLPVFSGPSYIEIASTRAGVGAGRVKTEIVHFLANTFTLRKFRDQRQVLGSELDLTDFDEAEMSVQSVLEFMAQAKADNKSPAVVSLRAREGTTFNLLRMYGAARPDHAANMRIYGKDNIQPADILNGKTPPPSAFAFPGFSALIDDLHALEALRKKEIPPEMLLRRPSRQDSSSRGPRQGFTGGPRGFHRFGSGSNRQQQPPPVK